MNRIILIGNGFDLAHGLPTRYSDFLNWYWDKRVESFKGNTERETDDKLCSIQVLPRGNYQSLTQFYFNHNNFWDTYHYEKGKALIDIMRGDRGNCIVKFSPLLERINDRIENFGWVDIEQAYYWCLCACMGEHPHCTPDKLNEALASLQNMLTEYLEEVMAEYAEKGYASKGLKQLMLAPLKPCEIAVANQEWLKGWALGRTKEETNIWEKRFKDWGRQWDYYIEKAFPPHHSHIEDFEKEGLSAHVQSLFPDGFFLPDKLLLVNFNYTTVADTYVDSVRAASVVHIHGELTDSAGMIFGYGDELDRQYSDILARNDNSYLQHMKSPHYLESGNYREVLTFLESAPFQIYIMGHSCGNSDRTLLNTMFEHPNCVSIKPFYYQSKDGKDNYLEIVQNISRSFTDMKLMRDRVVNKTLCEPIPQIHS